ncbi:MAG: hypothetical protein WAM42_18505 [Candidatus Nitrosopolaris sp.]
MTDYVVIGVMSRLDTIIDERIDKRFREAVFRMYGLPKWNIKRALEEAITLWLKTRKESGKT